MWHKQSFTQFWSQSDAYSRRSSLKLTYIHHPLVVCTHQICCAVAVPIALSQDRLLHGHNRLVNWTPCSRMRESKLKIHVCDRPPETESISKLAILSKTIRIHSNITGSKLVQCEIKMASYLMQSLFHFVSMEISDDMIDNIFFIENPDTVKKK